MKGGKSWGGGRGRRKQGREKRTCEWVNTIKIHVYKCLGGTLTLYNGCVLIKYILHQVLTRVMQKYNKPGIGP